MNTRRKKYFSGIIVLLAVTVLGLNRSIFAVDATENSDSEYERIIATDMIDATDLDTFVQIGKSIEEPLMQKQDIKQARNVAKKYITWLVPYDENWKSKNPRLIGKPIPYYTDDISEPIAYEWKIKCDFSKDCGAITIASLGGEYRVMETASHWKTNYELLGTSKKDKKNKLYYYSQVDQYIQSSDWNTISIEALDPGKNNSDNKTRLFSQKEKIKNERIKWNLYFSKDVSQLSQNLTWTTVNISGTATGNCGWPLPCYNQFQGTYAGTTCMSGCGPTALWIILWFYDRKWTFPNLVSGVASDTTADTTMINKIRWYMGTACQSDGQGGTAFVNVGLGMGYAREKGYSNSVNGVLYNGSLSSVSLKLKTEINAGRPVIVNYSNGTQGHIMAAYGYTTDTIMGIHVNFGWGWAYPDKYLPSSGMITSTQAGSGNPIIGMQWIGLTTVPIQ